MVNKATTNDNISDFVSEQVQFETYMVDPWL